MTGAEGLQNQVCQTNSLTQPCVGDSGGPLVIEPGKNKVWQQYGIISFANGDCEKAGDGKVVYTQVSKYVKWIKKVLNKYGDTKECESE